jgi:biopolymer transport protein ExbB/TolQ
MQFGLIEMWQAMGLLAKSVAVLLIILSIISVYFLIERLFVFGRAKKRSKQAAPKLAQLLKQGKIEETLSLSSKKEYKGSHLARVTTSGLTELVEGKKAGLATDEQIDAIQRGCERGQTLQTQELRKGMNTLATIATSAPFIGLFGTIGGIINAFQGMALTGSGGIGAVAGGIAEALITTAFGIGVAVLALWCHSFLTSKIEISEAEMSNTGSQLIDFFIRNKE